ncbi:hypothetical protein PILCRDRAFT_543175 [Piloderma croceum F 1598]|uniref:Secreted protein n=1 Tax=Piloderma croceum (strain F 1598) TaxID=765440 RepID=A0A0C3F5T3_PILCF|nr:hypothetical protein PILCRDRAFT_543175 [Piloderma croceum F 1598]
MLSPSVIIMSLLMMATLTVAPCSYVSALNASPLTCSHADRILRVWSFTARKCSECFAIDLLSC